MRAGLVRGLRLVALAAAMVPAALPGQISKYTISSVSPSAIPAGIFGFTLQISGFLPTFSPSSYGLCFYTGVGSTTPLQPTFTGSGTALFNIPSAAVVGIPPSSFSAGLFQAQVYLALSTATCAHQATPSNTLEIDYPALNQVLSSSLLKQNTALSSTIPSLLDATGSSFLDNSSTILQFTFAGSSVNGSSIGGASTTTLASTLPLFPAGTPSVSIAACNVATYTYCSPAITLPITDLVPTSGTLTATPNPATTTQTLNLSARFGPAAPTVAGAPSGTVTFKNGGTTLGTAKLQLDQATASFIASASIPIQTGFGGGSQPGPIAMKAGALAGRTRLRPRPKDEPFGSQDQVVPYVVDFNKDGIPDLLTLSSYASSAELYLGTSPGGSLVDAGPLTPGANCGYIQDMAIGDVNGDGYPDIVFICYNYNSSTYANELYVALNANGQGFGTVIDVGPTYAFQVALGDLNGDGKLDIMTAGPLDSSYQVDGFQTYLQTATNTFTVGPAVSSTYASGGQLTLADFNKDGMADMAIANYSSDGTTGEIDVFQNAGGGTFSAAPTVFIPTVLNNYNNLFYVAPLTVGASPSILFESGSNVDVAKNTGASAIAFSTPTAFPITSLQWFVPGDFNGDGDVDMATYDGSTVSLLLGDGTSNFAAAPSTWSASLPSGLLLASSDQNGDGYSDLLVISSLMNNSGVNGNLQTLVTTGSATATTTAGPLGAGTQPLTATINGTPYLAGSTATGSVVVNSLTPVVTFPMPGGITYGTALSSTQLTASASYGGSPVAGTFTFTPAAGTVLAAGVQPLSVLFVPTNPSYSSVTATTTINVAKAQPVVSWTMPAPISYGTTLSAAQLNATVVGGIAGTFTYTPAAGTVLQAGTQTLNVLFTPTDTADYLSASGSTTIVVNNSALTISWAMPAPITYGTALSATQLNATVSGGVAGTFTYTPAAGTVLQAGTQTLSVTFTPTNMGNYQTTSGSTTIVVNKAQPVVSWTMPAPISYGTALSATQLNATVGGGIAGTFAYTPAAGTVLSAGTQALNVTFAPTDTVDYLPASGSISIVVSKVQPVVSWARPAPISYGTALSAAQLNATVAGGIAGTFTYTPAAGTVLQAGTQTLNVLFTPTDTADYLTASGSTTLVVNNSALTINWATPAPITYGTALSATQLNATVSGGVAGTFTYTPAAGTVLQAGTQTLSVTFTPTDTVNYQTTTGSTTLAVNKAQPVVNWAAPAPISYGTALSAAQLNATVAGGIAGTFAYTPAAGTVLQAGTQMLNVTFTPTDTTDYLPASGSTNIVVAKAQPVVSWTMPAPISYGTALSATQLNATVGGGIAGTFTYTPAAGTVLQAGAQTLNVLFTPTDTVDYLTASGRTTLVVNNSALTINWTTPAPITYGTALSATQLNATVSGGVAGTFTYTPAAGTVLQAGTQTLNVTFTPIDTVNYQTTTGSTTILVNKAQPVVSWTMPAAISYGTALSATQLNATVGGGIAGTFAYTPAAGTVLSAGTQALHVIFTPTDTTDYQTATASTTLLVNNAGLTISWPSPAPITYGTPLSATQLNATVSGGVAGTFVYSPAAGTVLAAGTQTLNVTFTPNDTANYQAATASTTIVVNSAGLTINWAPPASITYGTALSATQLNATVANGIVGTFSYTPSAGTVLAAGTQTLNVTFTPTNPGNYRTASASVTLTIGKATPTLTWPMPTGVVAGTVLTASQLDATATGVDGAALPGSFVYTPAVGSTVTSGNETLSVQFTPTDTADYTVASATVSLAVTATTLASLSPASVNLGSGDTSVTITGTGFASDAVVQINGAAVATTFVNTTTLTAVVPTADFKLVQSLPVTVTEAREAQSTTGINLSVVAPPVALTFTGPPSSASGDQPALNFTLTNPYPVDLTGVLTLTFQPAVGGVDDPSIQFASGGRTQTFTVPANSTVKPNIALQTGTVAGTIRVTLTLTAGGADVTPASLQPLLIQAPPAAPTISSVNFSISGTTLTVTVRGFSNTREVAQAIFHLSSTGGPPLTNPDQTLQVGPLFTQWYSTGASNQYGSAFLYTQTFHLSNDISGVDGVTVTLVNSIGTSATGTTP